MIHFFERFFSASSGSSLRFGCLMSSSGASVSVTDFGGFRSCIPGFFITKQEAAPKYMNDNASPGLHPR